MPTAPVLPAIKATYPIPATKPDQSVKRTKLSVSKAYTVKLSGAALARSLKLKGFSIKTICIKLGVDVSTVKQYLGIIEPDATSLSIQPKTTTYKEKPKANTQARDQLFQDLKQVHLAWLSWSTLMPERPGIDTSA